MPRNLAGASLVATLLLFCAPNRLPTVPLAPTGPDTLGQRQVGRFEFCNRAPLTPSRVLGPDTVTACCPAEFLSVTSDPEGDLIAYLFDWGDGDTVAAPGYASGDTARMLHAWLYPGEYRIRVRARDAAGHDCLVAATRRDCPAVRAGRLPILGPGVLSTSTDYTDQGGFGLCSSEPQEKSV